MVRYVLSPIVIFYQGLSQVKIVRSYYLYLDISPLYISCGEIVNEGMVNLDNR